MKLNITKKKFKYNMEFRSYSQLQNYISQQPRHQFIGFVTNKTLIKWKIPIHIDSKDNKYIFQHGNNFSIYTITQKINFLSKYSI